LDNDEVYSLLNENLRLELTVHLNGKMLHDNEIFSHFEISFLSEVTFHIKNETYVIDDRIFEVKTIHTLNINIIGE